MSTSDPSPLESDPSLGPLSAKEKEGRRIIHSMCDTRCGPECLTPERGLNTGARRRLKAETAHRVAIEPYAERARRLPIPWGLIATALIVFGLAAYGIFWSGDHLGWW